MAKRPGIPSDAMETTCQHEYHIRDLETRSVTLFPARALIVRDIEDVAIKPGANQITVVGLSPTVDEQSIKVEGTGSAIITDIAVELLPNRDIFRDFYPELHSDDSGDEASSTDEDDDSDDDSDEDSEDAKALEAVRDKLAAAVDEQKRGREIVCSAESQTNFLNQYANRITLGRDLSSSSGDKPKGAGTPPIDENIAQSLDTYRAGRAKAFESYMDGLSRQREATKKITKLEKEESRLLKRVKKKRSTNAKKKGKDLRERQKEKEKAARKKRERANEKARIRREKESFWPKKVYTLKISLDATFEEDDGSDSADTCDIAISYMTAFASWAPVYDLAVSTTENSGGLCFDALLTNGTSETWSGCKVTLSTSHADYSNLDQETPTLTPWRLGLTTKGSPTYNSDGTFSEEERASQAARAARTSLFQPNPWLHREALFGVDPESTPEHRGTGVNGLTSAVPKKPSLFDQPARPAGGLFGKPAGGGFGAQNKPNGGLFGGQNNNSQPAASQFGQSVGSVFGAQSNAGGGLFGGQPPAGQSGQLFGQSSSRTDSPSADAAQVFAAAASGLKPELAFSESSFEETGFTTTYDLPGLKVLGPSSTASKQRVARISFADAVFKHKVVAKRKAAAYLSVELRNGDEMTLLRGRTGLTLDGSFMGRTVLPRCSPGDWFSLHLGIDPAIEVTYPKPGVKHSQSGMAVFNKEDTDVFTRSVTLSNTRSGVKSRPVQITVVDQVPVSEDERLRIVILQPRGLENGGPSVVTGVPAGGGKQKKAWGEAAATLKDGGEVSWDVSLNTGCKVKLPLEYQCVLPSVYRLTNV